MKKVNKLLIFVVLLVITLVLEVFIVKSVSKYEPKVNVIYAKSAISAKNTITEEMLKTKSINISQVHRFSVYNYKDLVGKQAKMDIEADEMVLSSKVGSITEMQEIKMKDKDNRLFSIEFKPDQANGWWVLVDQYVDVIFVPNNNLTQTNPKIAPSTPPGTIINNDAAAGNNDKSGITIENSDKGIVRINNVRVAAIIDEANKQLTNGDRESLPKYISFEVTPKQDEFLAWAKANGKLELSVRKIEQ